MNDDMRCDDHIGTAHVSLDSLLKDTSIVRDFKLEGSRGQDRGRVSVKITVQDPGRD